MRVFSAFAAGFLLLGVLFSGAAQAVGPINRAVAVVNGEMITSYDLSTAVAPEILRAKLDPKKPADRAAIDKLERQILERMINDIVVTQEAERLKVIASAADVDEEVRRFQEGAKIDSTGFEKELARQGYTLESFREQVRRNLLKSRLLANMVGRKVVVTRDEIAQYYEANKGSLPSVGAGGSVRIAVLVYPPNADVASWAKRIKSGNVSFEKAVREVSIGPVPQQGGDLGHMDTADLAPVLLEHLAGLKPGQVSEPFSMDGVQAQVKLISKDSTGASAASGSDESLEAMSPRIEAILREPKLQERYAEYMEQLRKRAVVDVRL